MVMEEILKLNQYFNSVVDMIPPSAYLGKNDFFQHKKGDKKLSNSAKKALTKKRKFDPETMKTTSEIIQKQNELDAKKAKLSSEVSVNPNSAKTLDQLQQCLKDKIAEQLAKRQSSKRTPEQQLVVTQRRREERQRKKAKQQKMMQKAKQDRKAQMKQLKASNNKQQEEKETENPQTEEGDTTVTNEKQKKKVLYSKIDFGNELEVELGETKRVVPKARKIKQQLAEVEGKDRRMRELRETDPEHAAKLEEEEAWSRAMDKSEGTKVKDDARLLRKSIKRREDMKKRSRNKWAERTAKVTEKMEKRQKIRKQNLANRRSGTKVVKKNAGGKKTKGKKMK